MTKMLRRRRLLQAGLGLGIGIAFPAARACDFFTTNLRIDHVWTRATGNDAFAVVCMTFDEVRSDDRLIGVDTPVAASAEIGGSGRRAGLDFFIPKDCTTLLDENGPHLRLTQLRHPLELGRSYPLTLVFEKGGVVVADIDVDYERLAGAAPAG